MNTKLLIKNKNSYTKETHGEIMHGLEHEGTFDCVELRFGRDYHYYVLNGEVEGIDIKLKTHKNSRRSYYRMK